MREEGYYWVKYEGEWHVAHYVGTRESWSFAAYIDDSWWFRDEDFEEIDERRLIRE
jgi:hypothetical protein